MVRKHLWYEIESIISLRNKVDFFIFVSNVQSKMQPGDGVVFYSPKLHYQPKTDGKAPARAPKEQQLRAFTAIGHVDEKEPYVAPDMPPGFWRRNVVFQENTDAPIAKLINQLEFTRVASPPWGLLMRRGFFEISKNDFELIGSFMITK
jgi:hypothetical protein